jgi:hypothetical protein
MGVGEKTDALEPFYPERIASRILGMGDVLSLIIPPMLRICFSCSRKSLRSKPSPVFSFFASFSA